MYLFERAETIQLPPRPYVLDPSGSFDGNDGKWSTFSINVGDSEGTGHGQNFKVLISTSSPLTLVPQQAEWCDEQCAKDRGVLLYDGKQSRGLQESASWQTAGLYNVPLPYWWSKELIAKSSNGSLTGLWGSENVGLGESSDQSPILASQYVVKYTFEDFFLGSFGLAAGEAGPQGGSKPNFINNFYKSANQIASATYGFTAGASYRNDGKGVPGNMVLGGYDASRLSYSKGTSIRMPSDKNNTLSVGVQSILYAPDPDVEANTFSFTSASGGFSAVIDSTTPYLILPDSICDKFVERFQLELDDDIGLYTVNSSAHNWNVQQNATVSFKIGNSPRDSDTFTTIVLPYAAFDLEASFPLVEQSQKYFPIRRSENGIFVLGRAFLQEAYLVVDYERANFTVAPASFAEPMPEQNLVTIYNTTYTLPAGSGDGGGSGLPAGAIAGIVVGIVLLFVIAGVGAFFWWRRRRAAKGKGHLHEKPAASDVDTMVAGNEIKHRRVSELSGSEHPQSIHSNYNETKAFPAIAEMSPESTPAELYSPPMEGAELRDGDYFVAGRIRRRGATRDSSSGHLTPHTPIAELPGEDVVYSDTRHSRSPSESGLSANIDEVLANENRPRVDERLREPSPASAAVIEGEVPVSASDTDQRPSHTRGLSDSTVQSDSTAVSQPSPEELERWARSGDTARPMSLEVNPATVGNTEETREPDASK